MNKLINIKRILFCESIELNESIKIYNSFYNKSSTKNLLLILKRILFPLKFIFSKKKIYKESKIVIDSPNYEKFKRIQPFAFDEKSRGLIIINDISSKRSSDFYRNIGFGEEKSILLPDFSFHFRFCISAFLYKILGRSRVSLLLLLILYYDLSRYEKLMRETKVKKIFCACEDTFLFPVLSLLSKVYEVELINIVHGKMYDVRQFFDLSIVFSERQKKFVLDRSPMQKTIIANLLLIEESKYPKKIDSNYNVLYFDQPYCDVYPFKRRQELLEFLLSLKRNHNISVTIKLHPAQESLDFENSGDFNVISNVKNRDLFPVHSIAISACSTVGIECILADVPIVYWNFDNNLDAFEQLAFIKETSVRKISDLHESILNLKNTSSLSSFLSLQKRLLLSEYGTGLTPREIKSKYINNPE